MRNGLDISGASELAHEIGRKPIEAVIDFRTKAFPTLTGSEVEIGTAHHGTQRMARSFRVPFAKTASGSGDLTPLEGAVAALGACVLITHVHGYSARGITIRTLQMRVTATADVDTDGGWTGENRALHDLKYVVEADCDGPVESVFGVSNFVACFSPNHRAFLDEGHVEMYTRIGDDDPVPISLGSPKQKSSGDYAEIAADLRWEYGTETHIETATSARRPDPKRLPGVVVDQSKQMLGIDSGPNPQELLLAATSADLMQQLVDLAEQHDAHLPGLHIEASGRLDIRGMLNVSSEIPTRFHNIQLVVCADAGADPGSLNDLTRTAAEYNIVLSSLLRSCQVSVNVRTSSGETTSFESNGEHVRKVLAEMAQAQALSDS